MLGGLLLLLFAVAAAAVLCLNVGDSRAVLSRAGRAVSLSRDHKPGDASEMRRIIEAGGRVMSTRHRADPDGAAGLYKQRPVCH